MDKRLKQQLDFVLEIDKEKNILRQTHLSGHGRRENDAEHAWHMAIMSYLLREYSNESVDIAKVMLMCLIHDIVEIDELIALFDEFEDCETSESKYAHAMDNLQPLLLNHSNNGDDWKQHQITSKQVYGRQSKTKLGSERLYEITDHLIQDAIKKGFVKE